MWLRRVKDTEAWKDDQRPNVSQPAEQRPATLLTIELELLTVHSNSRMGYTSFPGVPRRRTRWQTLQLGDRKARTLDTRSQSCDPATAGQPQTLHPRDPHHGHCHAAEAQARPL
jgi:hypothetical protein